MTLSKRRCWKYHEKAEAGLVDLTSFLLPVSEILSHGTIFWQSRNFLLKNDRAGGILAPSQKDLRKGRRAMRNSAMHHQNTARFAQSSCACFACSENNSIIIILDAVVVFLSLIDRGLAAGTLPNNHTLGLKQFLLILTDAGIGFHQLPRHGLNTCHKLVRVSLPLGNLCQTAFPFSGKLGRGQSLRQYHGQRK